MSSLHLQALTCAAALLCGLYSVLLNTGVRYPCEED